MCNAVRPGIGSVGRGGFLFRAVGKDASIIERIPGEMHAPWLPSSWSDESKDVLASNDAPASDDAAAQGLASNDAPVDTRASDEATMGKPPPPEAQPANPRSEPK